MRVWVTGIVGFLGSHLADALVDHGHEVRGNDNLICGDINNTKDLCNYSDCRDVLQMGLSFGEFKPDVLVHCAATAHEGLSNFSPSFITKNIYEASVATFSAAIAAGVKRIVFMSSMARYGHGHEYCKPPFNENMPTAANDPYGIAKVAAEETLKSLCKLHDVEWSILVPHSIIGTRQKVDAFRNVATIMINRCMQGKAPIVYGDGQQMRCFSPVRDCIPSIVKAVNGEASGEVINIGPDSGEITILELAQKIMVLTGFSGDVIHMPDRPNEVKFAYCSSDKARRLLGYEERQTLDDCLLEMVESHEVKEFTYTFPIEIEKGCPEVWLKKLM